MYLLKDIVSSSPDRPPTDEKFFRVLVRLKDNIDWKSSGMFSDAGGQKGAIEVYGVLKKVANL